MSVPRPHPRLVTRFPEMERPYDPTNYNINGKLTIMNRPQNSVFSRNSMGLGQNGTELAENAVAAGRDDVDDAESAQFQLMQEGRQHPGGLSLGVMKQHDAAIDLFDPAENQVQL